MKDKFNHLIGEAFAIEVPIDAAKITCLNDQGNLIWFLGELPICELAELPTGKWQYAFSWRDCTNRIAAIIVDLVTNSEELRFRHYAYNHVIPRYSFLTAVESLASLLYVRGLDITKNYAIIVPLKECEACGTQIIWDKAVTHGFLNMFGYEYCSESCMNAHIDSK